MEVSRYVNLTYAIGFILSLITLNKAVGAIWEGFERLPDYSIVGNTITLTNLIAVVLSAGLIVYLFKREDYRSYVSEVWLELKKVTWPGWDETKRSTLAYRSFPHP